MSAPSIESLIPHRPPILLVERIVEVEAEAIVCEGRVPTPSSLAGGDSTTPLLAVELAAQAAAVLAGLGRAVESDAGPDAGASPPIGYLASLRTVRCHQPTLPAGQTLRASVRRTGGIANLNLYAAEVTTADGRPLVTATFGTMLVDAAPARD